MEIIETSWPKRRRAWTRLSGPAPICCGSRRGVPTGGPTNIGSVRRNSTFKSAPTLDGNRRGVRKGGLTNTWIGPVNLRSLSRWRRLIRIFRRDPSATCVSGSRRNVCARQLDDAVTRAFAKPGGFRNFGKKKRRVEDELNGRFKRELGTSRRCLEFIG